MFVILTFIPFFNFCYVWFLDSITGKRVLLLLIAHSYIVIFVLSVIGFWKICYCEDVYYLTLGTWINCGVFTVNWGFIFDSLSLSMLSMVCIISGVVHFYTISYMESDSSILRFVGYLSLFTFFMFILVTADNLLQLFLGWEGIGLCSYLLIGFWNCRTQANKSALKAIVINRIGDFGYLVGLILIYYYFRSLDFSVIFTLAPYFVDITVNNCRVLDIICLFLFIGSISKSAQIGLHTWLPDAMEGPTPVSALIHAATLVTAGVFLIIRCSPLFEFAPITLVVILVIGGLTTIFAATAATAQNDIKKVIAFSTCSQLGYMVFICGLSYYHISMFHLINHAFFKALLFLSAGSVIHSMSGEQDVRKYGKIANIIPYTYSCMFVGFIALSGLPFLAGFYSKDLILETAYATYTAQSTFVYWLGTMSASLTAFYSCRVFYLTFWWNNTSFKYQIQKAHELPKNMYFSLFILSVGSVFSGFLLKDAFVGVGSKFWGNSIFIRDNNYSSLDYEFIPFFFKNLPLMFSFLGIIFGLCLNTIFLTTKTTRVELICIEETLYNKPVARKSLIKFIWFFNNKWYFDYIYNYFISFFFLRHGYETFYKLIDKGFIEILGSQGLSNLIYKVASVLSKKQSGYTYQSSCLLILGLFFLLCFLVIL